ncbi:MAG: ABC transporter ATP-binding protein [Acidimicrobiales bacterium]
MTDTAISFVDVQKRYGPTQALAGASFEVARGETVALLGPNGAGKSTAVGIMLGLRFADAGRAQILGMSPTDAVSAGRVGAMLQTAKLPDGVRVREVVELVRHLYPRPLSLAALSAMAGLEDFLDRKVDGLSGGQAQRVRFALAVAGDPELVFLDEPTVGMDVETRRSFWSSMESLSGRGATVVFATHYLEEADAVADRVVVLDRGRVVADGTSEAIKAGVSPRVVRFSLPGADPAALLALPGVVDVAIDGVRVVLRSADSDLTVRALLPRYADAHNLEVAGAGLEDAFLALTSNGSASAGSPAPYRLDRTVSPIKARR